jgi:hypothetical protein
MSQKNRAIKRWGHVEMILTLRVSNSARSALFGELLFVLIFGEPGDTAAVELLLMFFSYASKVSGSPRMLRDIILPSFNRSGFYSS